MVRVNVRVWVRVRFRVSNRVVLALRLSVRQCLRQKREFAAVLLLNKHRDWLAVRHAIRLLMFTMVRVRDRYLLGLGVGQRPEYGYAGFSGPVRVA